MITYRYYDKKGRRLTIGAEQEGSSVIIKVITCSLDDQFCKRVGREALSSADGDFDITLYEIPNSLLTIKSFLLWCDENFYKKRLLSTRAENEVLYSPKTRKMVKRTFIRYYNKLDA